MASPLPQAGATRPTKIPGFHEAGPEGPIEELGDGPRERRRDLILAKRAARRTFARLSLVGLRTFGAFRVI